jgi:hypothetical protein
MWSWERAKMGWANLYVLREVYGFTKVPVEVDRCIAAVGMKQIGHV